MGKVKVDDFYTYELAGIGERVIALIVDNILLAVVGGLIGVRAGVGVGGGIAFLLGLVYHWYFWTQNRGQTPGKLLMGIRVVSISGERISDVEAILRYLGYYLNGIFIGLGWLWALLNQKRQGWHDLLAHTLVVRADGKTVNTVYVDSKPKR